MTNAHNSRTWLAALLVAVLTFAITAGIMLSMGAFGESSPKGGNEVASETPSESEPTEEETEEATPPRENPVEFTIVTAGDVLPHATVNRNALQDDGTYDYAPMMAGVRPWIEHADLALCSLEVPLRPPGTEVTAYPVFGAPEGLITSLKAVGWDGCATATNHSLDRRVAGLEYTLDVMDEHGMGHTGTGRSPEETVSAQFYEVTKEGATLTVAHLSATTFHNDYTDSSLYAPHLHALDPNQINELAKKAKEDGADIVLFTPHWGQEYWDNPDGLQKDISSSLARAGHVDIILGGHSHVPQPLVKLEGGPDGRGMWVGYSMGNFLSNQDEICCRTPTATGLIVTTTITLDVDGSAHVSNVSWMGGTVDTKGRQRLYPIQSLIDGERPEGITLTDAKIQARYKNLIDVMGTDNYNPAMPEPSESVVRVVPRS